MDLVRRQFLKLGLGAAALGLSGIADGQENVIRINRPSGVTRLGLFATAEELKIWQDRASKGPYKAASDVRANSPGDWDDHIIPQSTQSLSADRWSGYTGSGCVPLGTTNGAAVRNTRDPLLCAAFRYLVQGNTTYRDAVIAEIKAQAQMPGVDFSNRSKWCVVAEDDNIYWEPAYWVAKHCYAYDFVLAGLQAWGGSINSGDKAIIEKWLGDAASLYYDLVGAYFDQYIVNRRGSSWDNYTLSDTSRCTTDMDRIWSTSSAAGPIQKIHPNNWHNRLTSHMMPVAMVGLQQNNATWKADAVRYFKEFIAYGCIPTNEGFHHTETDRWHDVGFPSHGLSYPYTALGLLAQIGDGFARAGDHTLMDFTTTVGACGTATGATKTMLSVFKGACGHIDHTYLHYASETPSTNANLLIDSEDPIAVSKGEIGSVVVDHCMAQPNLYWQDTYIKSIYMRTAPGQNGYTLPGYPAVPGTGGYYAWGGAWSILPGILFMFGQNEGTVFPYP